MKKVSIVGLALLALAMGLLGSHLTRTDFTDLEGASHRWQNAHGKWTVVNYFAEWCAPCLREMPELNRFYQQYSDQYAMFAVSFDPLDTVKLTELTNKYDIQFPVIRSLKNLPWQQPPRSLPTTYILDEKGNLRKQIKGELSAEELQKTLSYLQSL